MNRKELTAELNHHIRNALNLIACSFAEADEVERLRICKMASQRIVQALERYLPMHGHPGEGEEDRRVEEERSHPREQD